MLHALNMLLVLFFTVRDKMYDCAWPMVLNIHDRYNTTVHLTMSHGSANMFKIFQKRQIMLLKSICLELMQEPLRKIPNWGMYVSNHSRTSTKVTNVHVIYHLKLLACPGFYLLSIENERHPSTLYLESKSCCKKAARNSSQNLFKSCLVCKDLCNTDRMKYRRISYYI